MITIIGTIAVVAILIAVVTGIKGKSEHYAAIQAVRHPGFGWAYHLEHRGEIVSDGFYPTREEAVAAAVLEDGRREADR